MKIEGKKIKVLDKGFVRLVDHMGRDEDIVDAARVSYNPESTKHTSSDRGLIRYLYRHKHTTPFEMCEIKLHLKMPVFVARQWIRHRTANINEVSGRYSILKDEFFVPSAIRKQSTSNKQGSEGFADVPAALLNFWMKQPEDSFRAYQHLVREDGPDVARELARIHLPLSTYTAFYWKVDLHNLLHFLKLRTDPHAQEEIRLFADAIESIVELLWPLAHEAWVDYSKEAHTFSRMEMEVLRLLINTHSDATLAIHDVLDHRTDMSEREKREFASALLVK